MIFFKTADEIGLIRQSSLMVSKTLAEVAKLILPGTNTEAINRIADEFIRDHGGIPAFLNYNGFPKSVCISVNEEVVHGIPSGYELKDGDIVSVDVGVLMNGYFGDSAYTFEVGEVSSEIRQLVAATRESLYQGIAQAVDGKRVGDIGYAVQDYVERRGYSVVRELVGHGVGKNLHEKPEVPNFGRRGTGVKLMSGMVIAIEPMINLGKKAVRQAEDGWTVFTADRLPSAHFEHTVAIARNKADILSDFSIIDEVLNKRKN
ncbi:MAG: type I methionyl aminopeptidase [Bacteroidia bacterium]|nr:type I methionyl aminopeptidase [Bacteroidia bacterium]